jgi:hypothetical protein
MLKLFKISADATCEDVVYLGPALVLQYSQSKYHLSDDVSSPRFCGLRAITSHPKMDLADGFGREQ